MKLEVINFIQSIISVLAGGCISMLTQFIISKQGYVREQKELLKMKRFDAITKLLKWLAEYDKPPEDIESIHHRWAISKAKVSELRVVYLESLPFISNKLQLLINDLLQFWQNDIKKWRNGRAIIHIGDRTDVNLNEYSDKIQPIFETSQKEISNILIGKY
jgi:hypothetical protein